MRVVAWASLLLLVVASGLEHAKREEEAINTLQASELADCLPGQYMAKAGTRWGCLDCPAGRASPNKNQLPKNDACKICEAGKAAIKGSSSCVTCSGSYTTLPEQASCTPCDAGKYSNTVPGTAASDCKACGIREWSIPGSTACKLCSGATKPGSYITSVAGGSCKPCAVGRYSASGTSTSCTPCEIGKFADKTGSASCTRCPVNTYATAGQASCTTCSADHEAPDFTSIIKQIPVLKLDATWDRCMDCSTTTGSGKKCCTKGDPSIPGSYFCLWRPDGFWEGCTSYSSVTLNQMQSDSYIQNRC